MTAPIKAILPWFGAKRTLAPEIVRELGKHQAYWEPFCGSMAVLFAKDPCGHEYVNDLHGDLINLANVLASERWFILQEKLKRTLCSEHVFEFAKKVCHNTVLDDAATDPFFVGDAHIERAYLYVIYSWLGMNGFGGTNSNTSFPLRFTTSGGSQSRRFRSLIDSLESFHERLRFVSITRRDANKLLQKIDDSKEIRIYADPPYLLETRTKGGNRYIHDMTDSQHETLAAELNRFTKTRVIVSYYDSPNLDRLFPGWTIRRFNMNKQMAMHSHRGSEPKNAPEVLLINGPSLVDPDAEKLRGELGTVAETLSEGRLFA